MSDFDAAVLKLGETYIELDHSLCRIPNFNVIQRHRIANGAYDIVSFAPIFEQIHRQAVESVRREETRISRMTPEELLKSLAHEVSAENWNLIFLKRDDPERRLKVAYKAMFYLIRAYQDSLYGVLLALCGGKLGREISMNKARKNENNPVYKVIVKKFQDTCPGSIDGEKSETLSKRA